jgi:hypothetical protein
MGNVGSRPMKIVRRILLILFGFVSGLIGFTSLLVSVTLTLSHLMGTGDRHDDVRLTVLLFVYSELFLAFGIAASCLSLKCLLGPKRWVQRTIDVSWRKSMRYGLALPFIVPVVAFGAPLILRLVQWFTR